MCETIYQKQIDECISGADGRQLVMMVSSKATRKSYKRYLTRFIFWSGLKKIGQLSTVCEGNPKLIKDKVIDYIDHLDKTDKLSNSSIRNCLDPIRSYYDNVAEIVLNWKAINKTVPKDGRKTKDRAWTKSEIKRMLSVASLRFQAVILFMICAARSGGVYDPWAMTFLTFGDLLAATYKGTKMYRVHIYNESEDKDNPESESASEYYALLTPEATDKLDEYLDSRRREGEIITPSSPLFRSNKKLFKKSDDKIPWKVRKQKAREEAIKNPQPLTHYSLEEALDDIQSRAGVKKILRKFPSGRTRNEVQTVHGFRKFATDQMKESGMSEECRKVLTAHTIGVEKSYVRYFDPAKKMYPKEGTLKQFWTAVPYLTIDESKYNYEILVEETAALKAIVTSARQDLSETRESNRLLREAREKAQKDAEEQKKQNEKLKEQITVQKTALEEVQEYIAKEKAKKEKQE